MAHLTLREWLERSDERSVSELSRTARVTRAAVYRALAGHASLATATKLSRATGGEVKTESMTEERA